MFLLVIMLFMIVSLLFSKVFLLLVAYVDLPVLEKLSFGQYSFFNTTYLSLSTLPKCTELIMSPFSFYACESFTGIDISSIRSVSLQMNCFYLLKEITKKSKNLEGV